MPRHILWVDDEIDLLQSHHIFLERKGYRVTTANNGNDAIALVERENIDLVLLDEMMPGKNGLETLIEIKKIKPNLPVVMVTKNEAEDLLDQAIGKQIDGYLLKPIHPMQVLSVCKQILDKARIQEHVLTPDYARRFAALTDRLREELTWAEWITLYRELIQWEQALERLPDEGLRLSHGDLNREANAAFTEYVRANYVTWMKAKIESRPALSPDVMRRWVFPHLAASSGQPVFFITIDCLRLDQWLMWESILQSHFSIETEVYVSILPTATPYARNAIFAGLFPDQIAGQHPLLWSERAGDESSRNSAEEALLQAQVKRERVLDPQLVRYVKANTNDDLLAFRKRLDNYLNQPLTALVVNFLDILTHGRSESAILKELAHDEAALRSITLAWFQHSALYDILTQLARARVTVIITTDHGAVLCRHATKVIGDRDTSANLRYKFGANLQCDDKTTVRVTKPADYHLPADYINKNYLISTADFYFVYPTNFHHYQRYYADSFQHGGISMEEMLLPVATLRGLG